LRSMQTGQNSIAPESSLPQLGQVRWDSGLMGLPVLQPQPEPKAAPRSTGPCRLLPNYSPVPQVVFSIVCSASNNRNEKHQTHRDIRRQDIFNRTKIQKILGRLKALLIKSAALIEGAPPVVLIAAFSSGVTHNISQRGLI
jgi:hypothetical protein